MGAIFTLLGGIKGIAIIVLVATLGVWAFKKNSDVKNLTLQRDTAISQRDAVAVERDKAVTANAESQRTIESLQYERDLANKALNTINDNRATNRQNTVTREVIIQNQASNSVNAGAAAPVFGPLIGSIQEDRVRRRSAER
jgi:hypothetical protein